MAVLAPSRSTSQTLRRVGVPALAALLLNACQCDYVPERLPGISAGAVWAGGPDGGSWIECSFEMDAKANWCTAWDDVDGHVVARTYYVLRDSGQPITDSVGLLFFDGLYIHLVDGRLLEPQAFHLTPEEEHPPAPIDPPRGTPP